MAQSKATKKFFQMAYGLGASVVIIGALFKILHLDLDLGGVKIGGGLLLGLGLVTESIIFAISAFEPLPKEYDWAVVFPELAGGEPRQDLMMGGGQQLTPLQQTQMEVEEEKAILKESLAAKLDDILAEAKLDANLVSSLTDGIQNFTDYSKQISPVVSSIGSINRYSEELSSAASNLEALNSLYRLQLERTENQVSAQLGIVDNMNMLNEEFVSFKDNLSSLNRVYGGMLSAMK